MDQDILNRVGKHFGEETQEHDTDCPTGGLLQRAEHVDLLDDILGENDGKIIADFAPGLRSLSRHQLLDRRQVTSKLLQKYFANL